MVMYQARSPAWVSGVAELFLEKSRGTNNKVCRKRLKTFLDCTKNQGRTQPYFQEISPNLRRYKATVEIEKSPMGGQNTQPATRMWHLPPHATPWLRACYVLQIRSIFVQNVPYLELYVMSAQSAFFDFCAGDRHQIVEGARVKAVKVTLSGIT